MSQCEETEEILHPPETTLSGEHGTQTKAWSIEQLLRDFALRMESSGSESETGIGKAFDSSKRIRSKTEPIYFNDGQRHEQLRKDALVVESSGSESESESESETGNGTASDSGVSFKSDRSKEEPAYFKKRMSAQSEDSSDSDRSEETFPPPSRSVGSDCEVSNKNDGSDDNLWSPPRETFISIKIVLLRPIGSSCVSVLGHCSERQRSHSFPQRRRRHKRIQELSEAGWKHGGGTSQEAPAGPVCSTVSAAVSTHYNL